MSAGPIEVTVRLYGAARVALHCRERELTLPRGATVADLVDELVREIGPLAREYLVGPGGRGYAVAFSVNGEAAQPEARLRDGDQVALLPPTAGG